MTIPQEAVEAAAKAMFVMQHRVDVELFGKKSHKALADACIREAKNALTAAEPHLRAKWAEELERAMFKVESVHHFGFGYHGFKCLCGFESLSNRSRTEHITQAVRNLLEGAGE